MKKINAAGIPFEKYVGGNVFRGVLTGFNDAFVIDEVKRKEIIKNDKKSSEIIKPFLAGRDIKQYQEPESSKYLIFAKRGIDIEKYPAIKKHLFQYKENLMPKPKNYSGKNWKGRKPGSYKWYEIQDAVDYFSEFDKPKIIYPNILKQPEFTFDTKGWFTNQKCFIIPTDDKYLLGFLNSKLNYYLFEKYLPKLRGGFYEPSYVFFRKFPVKKINTASQSEKKLQAEIIENVNQILNLKSELMHANLQSVKDQIETQIECCKLKIDRAVYQLYDLTQEEIDLVEGNCIKEENKAVRASKNKKRTMAKRVSRISPKKFKYT